MAQVLTRFDSESEAALDRLVAMTGYSKSRVIRDAVLAADREMVLARVEAESRAFMADPDDVSNSLALAEEMGEISAW